MHLVHDNKRAMDNLVAVYAFLWRPKENEEHWKVILAYLAPWALPHADLHFHMSISRDYLW